MKSFTYLPIKKVFYGIDSNKSIHDLLNGVRRAYIVTGKKTSESKEFKDVLQIINDEVKETEVLNYISQHAPVESINLAMDKIDNSNEKFIIVAYGGGAVIDSAKIIKYNKRPSYMIAIPTTLSASEFSHIAGYTNKGSKKGIRDISITPDYIILDPANTLSTPKEIYLSSGIRAIDHAIESSLYVGHEDPRVYFSINSYKLLFANLLDESLHGRMLSQIGAWLSYLDVYDAPMGYSHNVGKIIGARYGIPHGVTSCITLPAFIKFYKEKKALDTFLELLYGKNDYERLYSEVKKMINNIGLSTSLSSYGVQEHDLISIFDSLNTDDKEVMNYLKWIYDNKFR